MDLQKSNAYLGVHDMTIIDVSARYHEAVYDEVDQTPVLINPEDLLFTITVRLDNDLPYDIIWPACSLEPICKCFGLNKGQLLDSNLNNLLGKVGRGHFYRFANWPGAILYPLPKE